MATSPSFPKGLRVLLVAGDDRESLQTQLQCPELGYSVTSVGSAADALGLCRGGVAAFDVVLAESRMVAADEVVGRSFVDSFEDTPVVLMSGSGSTNDVMRAVKLGAVDFLDKPLSLLKLKNIWQHSVRKMMAKASGPRRMAPGNSVCMAMAPAPVATAAPTAALAPSPWTALAAVKPATIATIASESSLPPPESPGTPSAVSADAPEYSMSLCSSGADSGAASLRGSFDGGPSSDSFVEALNSAMGGDTRPAAAPLPRPTSVTSLPTAAPAAPLLPAAHAAHHWPALTPGCVWGTPANGPVAPPLNAWGSSKPPAPVLIRTSAPAPAPAPVLPAPVPASSHHAVAPPRGLSAGRPAGPSPWRVQRAAGPEVAQDQQPAQPNQLCAHHRQPRLPGPHGPRPHDVLSWHPAELALG